MEFFIFSFLVASIGTFLIIFSILLEKRQLTKIINDEYSLSTKNHNVMDKVKLVLREQISRWGLSLSDLFLKKEISKRLL